MPNYCPESDKLVEIMGSLQDVRTDFCCLSCPRDASSSCGILLFRYYDGHCRQEGGFPVS